MLRCRSVKGGKRKETVQANRYIGSRFKHLLFQIDMHSSDRLFSILTVYHPILERTEMFPDQFA